MKFSPRNLIFVGKKIIFLGKKFNFFGENLIFFGKNLIFAVKKLGFVGGNPSFSPKKMGFPVRNPIFSDKNPGFWLVIPQFRVAKAVFLHAFPLAAKRRWDATSGHWLPLRLAAACPVVTLQLSATFLVNQPEKHGKRRAILR
jgi:hypothetical protein